MMDEKEDRFDAMLREAAQDYHEPPVPPKSEMWERIQAGRAAVQERGRGAEGQRDSVLPFRPFARPRIRFIVGIAALLALGVAIGRISVPKNPAGPGAAQVPATGPATGTVTAAEPTGTRSERGESVAERRDKGEIASQVATVEHLGQVESFLTEFTTRRAALDFSGQARDLLSTTRLLLDSKRLTDVGTRKLLEDLELVLMQIATLNPKGGDRQDLDLITDGLAQDHLQTRLRNAVPAGPLRM